MTKARIMTLAAIGLLAFTPILGAADLPTRLSLNLDSGTAEIEQFRAYATSLRASQWPELSALGELAFEMAQSLELGDDEGFVANNAVMSYRQAMLPEELRLELLRVQLGVECSHPQATEKAIANRWTPCTTDKECFLSCGSPGSFCPASGMCACM